MGETISTAVYSLLGQQLFQKKTKYSGTGTTINIPDIYLHLGITIIRVTINEQVYSDKLLILK
jgi:hypothetical protein